MRTKDQKICWPFSDLDNVHKSDKHVLPLPPVYDLSFNCRNGGIHWEENSNKGAAEGFVYDSCHSLRYFPSASTKAPEHVITGRTMVENASNLSCDVTLISQSEPVCVSHEVTEIEPVNRNLKVTAESPAENLPTSKQTPADHLNGRLTLQVAENDSTVDVYRAHHITKFQESGDISMESNESTFESSDSADDTAGNSLHHCHLGKLHRRRIPKIRLLTDLLGGHDNMKKDKDRHVESSPSNGTPEASAQADARYASKCQITLQENVWHSGCKRERRSPPNGKCKHQEIPSSSGVDKQIQTWRGDIENSVSSLDTENALSRTIQTEKNLWSSYKMDGNNTSAKKKSKRFPVVDPYSVSLQPSKGKDQNEIWATAEYRSDKEALDNAAIIAHRNDSRTPHPMSLNAMESKSSTNKNPSSSKEPVIVEGTATIFPWDNGMIGKSSVLQKDMETMRTLANPSQYANIRSNERELHLLPYNYFNPQRDHKGIGRGGENELPTSLAEQDDILRITKFRRKDIKTHHLGDSNPPDEASDVFYGQGVHSVLNSKIANLRMPLPRQNVEPDTDNGWLKLRQKDIYSGSNGKKTIEAQEPFALIKGQINQRVDLASDCGTSDDIPMEIVELMAKNQYERCLHDAENNKHLSETSKFSTTVQVNNYADLYGNGRGLSQKSENHKQKGQARNEANAAICAGRVLEAKKQKLADYLSNIGESCFNTNHVQQTRMLGDNAPIPSREKPSSGIQFSSIESKRQSSTESRKCNGTILESRPYNCKLQSFGGCIDYPPVSEQNIEAPHRWTSSSSMMRDHSPYGYQRFPAQSTDREKIPNPTSLPMGNTITQNYHDPTNLENHGRHYNSEAYSQKFAEGSFCHHPNMVELHQNLVGSLEMYSNETIPAMHLLSLMDAGMRSNNESITGSGKHKFSKKPPIQAISYPSSAFHDEVQNKSHYRSPAAAVIGASTCTFQHSRGFGTDIDFSGQAVFKSRKRGKIKCSDQSTWSKVQKLPKSPFRSGGLCTDDRAFLINGIQKGVVSASNSKVFELAPHMGRNSEETKSVAQTKTLHYEKSIFGTETCTINKNPADFSVPEAGNIYMIGAEDFSFGRSLHSKSSINFNGFKWQRTM